MCYSGVCRWDGVCSINQIINAGSLNPMQYHDSTCHKDTDIDSQVVSPAYISSLCLLMAPQQLYGICANIMLEYVHNKSHQ